MTEDHRLDLNQWLDYSKKHTKVMVMTTSLLV